MTNSEFFKAAHKVARETRANFMTYRMAFSAALKGLYAMEKSQKENPFKAAYDLAAEIEATNAVAREIGHRIHMTGKGGNDMLATMRNLDALNDRRCEMMTGLKAEYKVRKLWKDEAAHAAFLRLFSEARPVDELSCYC